MLWNTARSILFNATKGFWFWFAGGCVSSEGVAGWLLDVDAAAFDAFLESSPEGELAATVKS